MKFDYKTKFCLNQILEIKSFTFIICLDLFNCFSNGYSLEISVFNQLNHLECLNLLHDKKYFPKWHNIKDLNPPKLKYLALNCNCVQRFNYLKLNFIRVRYASEIDIDAFQNQTELKGVFFDRSKLKCLNSIEKEFFQNTKLKYLSVNYSHTYGGGDGKYWDYGKYKKYKNWFKYDSKRSIFQDCLITNNPCYFALVETEYCIIIKPYKRFEVLFINLYLSLKSSSFFVFLQKVSNYPSLVEFFNSEMDTSDKSKEFIINNESYFLHPHYWYDVKKHTRIIL